MNGLEVHHISKSFDATEVLKDISFSVAKGDILAIIGSSGSGKTTLLRCLNFLETIDQGEIIVDGETLFNKSQGDETRLSAEELRRKRLKMGLVFQSFNLFPHITVRDNLLLAPQALLSEKLKDVPSDQRRAVRAREQDALVREADQLLAQVNLSARRDNYPCTLSGGEKQRAAIARSLMLKPAVLCFDEPTSALDPLLTKEVLKVIRNLKSSDRTMVLVTHEMEFARHVADTVVFMHDGIIAESGTPEDIFAHPRTKELQDFLRQSTEVIA